MPETPESTPEVVIIGAGLSGLSCARHLARAKVPFVLVEASDGVGGRVRTDVVEGFRLDRGFQVFLTAYPEAESLLDYPALELKPFINGADIFRGGKWHRVVDPRRHLRLALKNLSCAIGSFSDKWRVFLLRKQLQRLTVVPRKGEKLSTADFLESYGFSETIISRFFRPFFGGIFLERELRTTARMFQFIFAMFVQGVTAVPRLGMQAIPDQLASRLPEGSLRLSTPVAGVSAGHVALFNGEVLSPAHIVLAVEEPAAVRLLKGPEFKQPPQRSCTCLYYTTDDATLPTDPIIYLDGESRGPVNNAAIMSNVSADYAPAGQRLISATVLGSPSSVELEKTVREQLTRWFGPSVATWRHLRTQTIAHAQPEDRQLNVGDTPSSPVLSPGLYRCGDYTEDVSINGALLSGRRAAEAVIAAR